MPRTINLRYHECTNSACGEKSSCGQDPEHVTVKHKCKFCLTRDKGMIMGTWKPEELTTYRQKLRAFRDKNPLPPKVPRKKAVESPTVPTVPAIRIRAPKAPVVA